MLDAPSNSGVLDGKERGKTGWSGNEGGKEMLKWGDGLA